MYASIYVHRVPRNNVDAFLHVSQEAAAVCCELGALDVEIFQVANPEAKYGCTTYNDALEVTEDEILFLEINRFRDRTHHDDVMKLFDADDRIEKLYQKMTTLIDIGRVVRGEFELTR